MERSRLLLSVSGVLLTWTLVLAGCSERVAGIDTDAQVYGVSGDGRALVGHLRSEPGVETGRVPIEPGSVWSMAGTGDAALVWVHGPSETLLVDARRWQVLNRWARVRSSEESMVARR